MTADNGWDTDTFQVKFLTPAVISGAQEEAERKALATGFAVQPSLNAAGQTANATPATLAAVRI